MILLLFWLNLSICDLSVHHLIQKQVLLQAKSTKKIGISRSYQIHANRLCCLWKSGEES